MQKIINQTQKFMLFMRIIFTSNKKICCIAESQSIIFYKILRLHFYVFPSMLLYIKTLTKYVIPAYLNVQYQNSKGNNDPQTFHKRSTNVPISNRNETKTFEFVPEFVLSKKISSIWSRRADSRPNRNYLFSI